MYMIVIENLSVMGFMLACVILVLLNYVVYYGTQLGRYEPFALRDDLINRIVLY